MKPMERIGVRAGDGLAQFILKDSGKPFFVKGFNYVRLRGGDHATFDAATESTTAHYDPDRAETMFATLSAAGFNTVRVFIIGRSPVNPGIAGNHDSTQALYEPYLLNVLDFLRRATRHGIRVFPTFGDGEVPLNGYYRDRLPYKGANPNAMYLTEAGIAARVEYITAFLAYIKATEPTLLPTILGVQCQNELCLYADQWPFTEKSGALTAPNGKTYDLSQTADRQALMDDGFRHYHERLANAIKEVDDEMLVAEGVFVPRAVGKDLGQYPGVWPGKTGDERYPPALTTIGASPLDFLDVHFYRGNSAESIDDAFGRDLRSTGFFTPEFAAIRRSKPLILGEFGAFDFVDKTFEQAVENMVRARDLTLAQGMNGMLYWTYDCFEQPLLHPAAKDWALFVGKMGSFSPLPVDEPQTVR